MLITERALRRMIRRALLNEAAMSIEDLKLQNISIRITSETGWTKGRSNWLIEAWDNEKDVAVGVILIASPKESSAGAAGGASSVPRNGPCSNAWIVQFSQVARPGAGPLLYDIAMEIATLEGGGLTSDRDEVSPSAYRVWSKYAMRGDVSSEQLDNMQNHLTPNNMQDNCDQSSAEDWAVKNTSGSKQDVIALRTWKNEPLSRVYKKSGAPLLRQLIAHDLLHPKTSLPKGLQ